MSQTFEDAAIQADSPEKIIEAFELAQSLKDILLITPLTLMYPSEDDSVRDQIMTKAVELASTEEDILQIRSMASDVLCIPSSSFMNATDWRKQLIRKFAAIRLGKSVDELQG